MSGGVDFSEIKKKKVSFVTTDKFSVRVTKFTSKIRVSSTHNLPFCF